MKFFAAVLVCCFLLGSLLVAAPIDGKWVSERKFERDGQSMTIVQTFDLKAEGTTLTGSATFAFGEREPMKADIKDGKIEGNKFSFATVMSTPNGEFKTVYQGTVEGNTIKGTAAREGGQERPFEAQKK